MRGRVREGEQGQLLSPLFMRYHSVSASCACVFALLFLSPSFIRLHLYPLDRETSTTRCPKKIVRHSSLQPLPRLASPCDGSCRRVTGTSSGSSSRRHLQ